MSVALSREQYEWLKSAIANWRQVQQTLNLKTAVEKRRPAIPAAENS